MNNTETNIKAIAEQLRHYRNTDNDAPRFIKEYLGEFIGDEDRENEIEELKTELDQLSSKHESLSEEFDELEDENADLKKEISDLKEELLSVTSSN